MSKKEIREHILNNDSYMNKLKKDKKKLAQFLGENTK